MTDHTLPDGFLDRLCQLSEAVGMAGDEDAIRKLVRDMLEGHADDVSVDTMGNLFVFKQGADSDFHVIAAAHMDEVGMMVTGVDNGVCSIQPVGGLDPRVIIGKPVWVGANKVPGVVMAQAVHLITDYTSVPDVHRLKVDVGGNGGKVKVGDRLTFAMPFANLGATVRGKALDDRVGVATLIELVRGPALPYNFTAAFTVQEEIGLRGARVAAYRSNADAAIVLETTAANDMPTIDDDDENLEYNTRLFAGPALNIADRATLHDRRLVAHFAAAAEANNITFQYRQPGGGGNDAGVIHRARAGVPTMTISLPTRYLHSPAAVAAIDDLAGYVALTQHGLRSLTAAVVAND